MESCHFCLLKGPKGLTDETYGFIKSWKRSIFVIDSYLKDDAFTAVKGMQSSKQGMWKGYHLSIEGVLKGYLFREKIVYKRVRSWTSGWSKPPSPPSEGDLYFQQIAWLSKIAWPSVLYCSCDGNFHQITFIFCSSPFSSHCRRTVLSRVLLNRISLDSFGQGE